MPAANFAQDGQVESVLQQLAVPREKQDDLPGFTSMFHSYCTVYEHVLPPADSTNYSL